MDSARRRASLLRLIGARWLLPLVLGLSLREMNVGVLGNDLRLPLPGANIPNTIDGATFASLFDGSSLRVQQKA